MRVPDLEDCTTMYSVVDCKLTELHGATKSNLAMMPLGVFVEPVTAPESGLKRRQAALNFFGRP